MKATEILMAEHQNILIVLNRLNEILETTNQESLKKNIDEIEFIIGFVKEYSDDFHHKKEEDIYFEWIGKYSPGLKGGPVSCMLSEHTTFRDLVANASNALNVLKKDANLEALEAMTSSLKMFTGLLQSHIEKEDTMLYQMAERLDLQVQCGDKEMMGKYSEVEDNLIADMKKYTDYCQDLKEISAR